MADQTPNEKLPYTCQIEPSNNDTVAAAAWAIAPSGPVVSAPANSGALSTVFISGVTVNKKYTLDALLTGASGAIYEGIIEIQGVSNH